MENPKSEEDPASGEDSESEKKFEPEENLESTEDHQEQVSRTDTKIDNPSWVQDWNPPRTASSQPPYLPEYTFPQVRSSSPVARSTFANVSQLDDQNTLHRPPTMRWDQYRNKFYWRDEQATCWRYEDGSTLTFPADVEYHFPEQDDANDLQGRDEQGVVESPHSWRWDGGVATFLALG
jgi:hypothetical protein